MSTNSPDPESTSFCPFDEEQLPHQLADAMYDPRMFFNKEVYFDPDIIGKIWSIFYYKSVYFRENLFSRIALKDILATFKLATRTLFTYISN